MTTKTIFTFLDEATADTSLQIIREEGLSTFVVDDDDGETEKESYLVSLIHKVEPDFECLTSVTSCFLALIKKHVQLFDFPDDNDFSKLKSKLVQIKRIVDHMIENTSTARNYFSDLTGIFKKYWVPKGESPTDGRHVTVIRRILKVDKEKVDVYLRQKERRRLDRLGDVYEENYEEVEDFVLKCYREGMVEDPTRKEQTGLLLSLMLCTYTRKIEILDPSIKYTKYKDIKKKEDTKFFIGNRYDGDDEDNSIEEDENGNWKSVMGYEYTIVQSNTAKNYAQEVNKYLDKGHDRYVPDRRLIKPTIILTAKQIIDGIKKFRMEMGIKASDKLTRKQLGAIVGSRDFKPFLEKYFSRSRKKAMSHGWDFGSHHMRKVGSNASYYIYKDRLKQITGKSINLNLYLRIVLSHAGSVDTSLSYSNVEVFFGVANEVFKLPNDELIRNMHAMVKDLQLQINELKTNQMLLQQDPTSSSSPSKDNAEVVVLQDSDGVEHTLSKSKHNSRRYKSAKDKHDAIQVVYDELVSKGIKPTPANFKRMGFGYNTVKDFKPTDRELEPQQQVEKPDHDFAIIANPAGYNQKRQDQNLKRDRGHFGDNNVIDKEEDCDVKSKKQKIDRDVEVFTKKNNPVTRTVCTNVSS